jgi:cbb3-type cytochrome oxidase subunit 3
MYRHDVLVQIGSLWFTFVFFLVLYCLWCWLALRSRRSQGRISYRRYAMYAQQLRRRTWWVFGASFLVVTFLYAVITELNSKG